MAKTTVLQGFYQGAPQIVDFLKGEVITKSQYDKEDARIGKTFDKIDSMFSPEGKKLIQRRKNLEARKRLSDNYVAFQNYTKQMQGLYSGKKKELTYDELQQLAANNRALRSLDLDVGDMFKYGSEGGRALKKFINIIMDNDYKKLQYIDQFPKSALKNVNINDLSNISLPKTDTPSGKDFDDLKEQMNALSERLKKLDDNMHINSSEFKKMKAAANALAKTLESPVHEINTLLVGEQLEALQAASMNYVKAKGVGRQSSQLGKDRMDFALDICGMSANYMDKFASEERIKEVNKFENDVMKTEITHEAVCPYFTLSGIGSLSQANFFGDKEKVNDSLDPKTDDDLEEEIFDGIYDDIYEDMEDDYEM